jgi:membrane peptidoglycan carboxypeptidase
MIDEHVPPRPSRRRALGVATPAGRRRAAVVARARLRASRAPRGPSKAVVIPLLGIAAILMLWGGGWVTMAALQAVYGGIPDMHELQADSMVYDRNGRLIADLHPPGETRIPVPLSKMSPNLADAIVAVEDRNFWSEGAVDVPRMVSAAWTDLRHGDSSQGASTITEQLAKVLYLDDSRSISRKLHQLFIARHLDNTLSKQQILEDYLNDVYFGHGATGVEAAAQTYFGVPAGGLDLAQSALLVGLPNAPADLDPLLHPQAAKDRQLVVLDAMVAAGRISQAQAGAAAAEPLKYADGSADNVDVYPIFDRHVAIDAGNLVHVDAYRAGLTIHTTLDSGLQDSSQAAVTSQVSGLQGKHVTDGALVAVDPPTGDILAYVGSAGSQFPASQIDMAAHPRQPGSTFKLFTYSTALAEKKVTMTTPIQDAPLTLPTGAGTDGLQPYTVHNYDMSYNGTLPVKETFANSLNIPAVKVELMAGVPNVVQTARNLGVTTLGGDPSAYGASLTLGTYPVPLWQMAQAGSVFATQGVLHPAHEISSITDATGAQLVAPPPAKQVMDPGVVYIVNSILTNDANRVLKFGAHSDLTISDHLVSAKTGTTQDFRDNLTVGWTPHLAIATWVGNADNSPMQGTTGLTGAAPIWHQVMSQAIGSEADSWPAPPSDVKQVGQDWYLAGTENQAGGTTNVHGDGSCRYWTYNNANYWWCGDGPSTLPGDPGPSANGAGGPTPTPQPGDQGGQGVVPLPTPTCHKHCP